MCKVIIKNPNEKAGFIIFNHIFSRTNDTFTIKELGEELLQYHLSLSEKELQKEINQMVNDGAVSVRVGYYKRMNLL